MQMEGRAIAEPLEKDRVLLTGGWPPRTRETESVSSSSTEASLAQHDGKVGLLRPVFTGQPVNGKPNISPKVTPKFKISRGTQASTSPLSPPAVPAKPAALSKPIVKTTPPPVPPKPSSYVKPSSPVKPAVLSPKPALLPKPVMKPRETGNPPVAPCRPHRTEKTVKPISPLQPSAVVYQHQTRKSFSLGRLEGIRCASMLIESTERGRGLHRDSGFVSCSLENVEHPVGRVLHQPVAPPRRRRQSADNLQRRREEPIYAVVDFSKKLNRRFPELYPPPKGKMELLKTEPLPMETEAAPTAGLVSSDKTDIEMIESSFAAITSIIESFTQPDVTTPPPQLTTAAGTRKLSDPQMELPLEDEDEEAKSHR